MSYLFGGTPFDGYARDGRRSLNGGGGGDSWINTVLEVAAVVVSVIQPELAPLAFAAVGAVEGTEKGGDAIWKGATTGAVKGAVAEATGGIVTDFGPVADLAVQGAISGAAGGATQAGLSGGSVGEGAAVGGASGAVSGAVGGAAGGGASDIIGKEAGLIAGRTLGGAAGGATSAALTGRDVEQSAIRGAEKGFLTSAGGVVGSNIGQYFQDRPYGYETAEGAYDAQGNKIADWNPETGQYETSPGVALASDVPLFNYGRLGESIGGDVGSLAYQYMSPPTTQSGGTATGGTATGQGTGATDSGAGQVLYPQIGTGTSALAQALRTTPTSAIGGGGVEPSPGEGEQQSVWNVSSLKLKDALGA